MTLVLLIGSAIAIIAFVFLTFLLIGRERYGWSIVTCILLVVAVYGFVNSLLAVAPELA